MAALGVLKASSSTPNIPATATISAVDRAVLEKMSNSGGSPDRFDLGSSADSLKLKRILHGQASSSASSSSFDSDESSESSAKSRVRDICTGLCRLLGEELRETCARAWPDGGFTQLIIHK